MINFCQFGAGRIGAIHARNITGHPNARLQFVVDPDRAAAQRLAGRHRAAVGSQAEALANPAVNGIHYLEHSTLCDCDGIDRRNARSSPVIKGMKEEDVERV